MTIFLFGIAYGQTEKTEAAGLTDREFRYLMVKYNRMVTNEENPNSSNYYLAADLNQAKGTFNSIFMTEQGSYFGLKVDGGITDGLFSVFQQSKLNTDLSVNLSYSRLIGTRTISYNNDALDELLATEAHERLLQLEDSIDNPEDPNTRKKKYNLTDSMIKKCKSDLDSIMLIHSVFLDEFRLNRITFNTLSGSVNIHNNNFNLFNSVFSDLDSQIVRTQNVNVSGELVFNQYSWSRPRKGAHSVYWSVGAGFSFIDNFSDLSKVELTDVTTYNDSITNRTVSEEITAYSGDYQTKLLAGRVFGDVYLFHSNNQIAFHAYPEFRFRKDQDVMINAGVGLYYSFQSKEDKEAKVNTELYWQWNDLTNTSESQLSNIKRTEIGVRFSVPISFIKP